jgi:hypothetical protein
MSFRKARDYPYEFEAVNRHATHAQTFFHKILVCSNFTARLEIIGGFAIFALTRNTAPSLSLS